MNNENISKMDSIRIHDYFWSNWVWAVVERGVGLWVASYIEKNTDDNNSLII